MNIFMNIFWKIISDAACMLICVGIFISFFPALVFWWVYDALIELSSKDEIDSQFGGDRKAWRQARDDRRW